MELLIFGTIIFSIAAFTINKTFRNQVRIDILESRVENLTKDFNTSFITSLKTGMRASQDDNIKSSIQYIINYAGEKQP